MRFDLILRTATKELTLFFTSPVAYLFVAVFLGVSLFVVFFSEAFFARNIADVRPLFEWMPLLLLFLSAAITMRLWSEERRTGTLEFVATVPVGTWEFVLGKFLACWTLLGHALLLTLPLPISISLLGDLDWGPVWAGYIAAMLLGAAYIAMGLFVSAWSDSQIVSLLVAIVLGGFFYLLGTPVLTNLWDSGAAEVLRSFGTGARFESITRGVVDLRDLYYYVALAAVFLTLNVYGLESGRWAADGSPTHHLRWRLGTVLLIGNLLLGNVLLGVLKPGRLDMTEGRIYSISEPTRAYLAQLQEPLLIRGYFSEKTHPLLAPLVPQMRDLLLEYQAVGGEQIRVELIDPITDPELEDEANTKYGITAVPFQVSDRYQASLVNSYFDVLVRYGDEFEVLNFRDLIEVKAATEDELDVALRNPEYDITRSIKKVLYGFQGSGAVFASIPEPVEFVGYVSDAAQLPELLVDFTADLDGVLAELAAAADGRLSVSFVDPQAGDGALALELEEQYGFRPMATSLFDAETFYYYLTLRSGETLVQVPLPDSLDAESAERVLSDSLKRFASGVLKTVALVAPEPPPPQFPGMPPQGGNQYQQLTQILEAEFVVEQTDLASGQVPPNADLLMLIEPEALSETALFAVDQFLMRGGTVVVNTGPFAASLQAQSMTVAPRSSGLEDWLAGYGVSFEEALVLDPQSTAFPIPVTRQAGGFSFQELVLIDYPYFVDLRGTGGFVSESPITADLPQLTLTWASPIAVDAERNGQRTVTTLLRSSPDSWLSAETSVLPQIDAEGRSTFVPNEPRRAHTLAVLLSGRFDSYFKDRRSPLLEAAADEPAAAPDGAAEPAEPEAEDNALTVETVLERSSDSARLYVVASNDFLADQITQMVGSADGTFYTNAAQFMANIVDYSLEDQSLLSIASRGRFNRTLPPLTRTEQSTVEWLNYGMAALGIVLLWLWQSRRLRAGRESYRRWLQEA
ncbi:MAG: Gldg family protein, partial [Pseudomonadota bacterium]